LPSGLIVICGWNKTLNSSLQALEWKIPEKSDAASDRDAFRESENQILLGAHLPIVNHIGIL